MADPEKPPIGFGEFVGNLAGSLPQSPYSLDPALHGAPPMPGFAGGGGVESLPEYGPPATPLAPQAGVPEQAPVAATNAVGDEMDESSSAEFGHRGAMTPAPGGPGQAPDLLTGINYGMFGPKGQELADETFVKNPARYREAAQGLATLEGRQAVEESEAGKRANMGSAIATQAFQRDSAERQKQLARMVMQRDELAKKYSNDLADTGKFWRNPGNIISGIFTALSSLGSAQNSQRMHQELNDAVNHDFMARKAAAEMGLEGKDKTIGAYRQLFHDKDAADMYGLSESYRQLAAQIKDVASGYVGPKAQARAEMLVTAAEQQSNLLHMKALQQAYMSPHFMQAVMAGAYKNTPGFIQYGKPGQNQAQQLPTGPEGQDQAGVPGEVNGIPTSPEYQKEPLRQPVGISSDIQGPPQVLADKPEIQPPSIPAQSKQSAKNALYGAQIDRAIKSTSGGKASSFESNYKSFMGKEAPNEHMVALWEKRVPGFSKQFQNHYYDLLGRSALEAQKDSGAPPTQAAVKKKFQELYSKDVEAANKAASTGFEQKVHTARGWAKFDRELNRVDSAAAAFGKTPDEFIGELRHLPVGQSIVTMFKEYQLAHGKAGTPASEQDLENIKAAERLHQAISNKTATYYHDLIGGNQSVSEHALVAQVIEPTSSWAKIRGFATDRSEEAGAMWEQSLKTVDAGPRAILSMRYGPPSKSSRMNTLGHSARPQPQPQWRAPMALPVPQ